MSKEMKLALLENLLENLSSSTLEKLKSRKNHTLKDAMMDEKKDGPTIEVTEVKSEELPVEKLPEAVKEKLKSLPVWDEEDDSESSIWDDEDDETDIAKRLFD